MPSPHGWYTAMETLIVQHGRGDREAMRETIAPLSMGEVEQIRQELQGRIIELNSTINKLQLEVATDESLIRSLPRPSI